MASCIAKAKHARLTKSSCMQSWSLWPRGWKVCVNTWAAKRNLLYYLPCNGDKKPSKKRQNIWRLSDSLKVTWGYVDSDATWRVPNLKVDFHFPSSSVCHFPRNSLPYHPALAPAAATEVSPGSIWSHIVCHCGGHSCMPVFHTGPYARTCPSICQKACGSP